MTATPNSVRRKRSATKPASDPAAAERVRRQNELLDEALMETFPASDPISVALVE